MKLIVFIFVTAGAIPVDFVQKVAENDLENLDNYLPKGEDFPKFHYSTTSGGNVHNNEVLDVIEFKHHDKNQENYEMRNETNNEVNSTQTSIEMADNSTNPEPPNELIELDPIKLESSNSTANRTARQEEDDDDASEENNTVDDGKAKESQESEEDEEEDTNQVTSLISAFLGGLSKPDGSVDVEAITGLLGSLSVQKDDGTYDFNGLTELLQSFFGGGEDGGGSNFGAFIGGLAGAFLKGIASPPGARGIGAFLGNTVTNLLPALSAPAPVEGDEKNTQQSDSGGFIAGLLSSLLGGLSNLSSGLIGGSSNSGDSSNSGGDSADGGSGSKFSFFKAIFSSITSLFSKSSHSQQRAEDFYKIQ